MILLNPYFFTAICIFLFMLVMFLIALLKKNNSIVDIGWGIGFIIISAVLLIMHDKFLPKQRLLMFLVALWGLRLASYIAIRNWGKPEDFRYANWRKQWGNSVVIRSFFQVFMLQGLIMYIIALPIIIIHSTPPTNNDHGLYVTGAMIWLLGFMCESLADHQMFYFKENTHNQGKIMNTGLWRYSRHPNYFGEALIWWGIFIIAIPSEMWYVSILSPITITFLLLKVSGVTMLEKKYDGNDLYSAYKRNTNAFIPWFPKK